MFDVGHRYEIAISVPPEEALALALAAPVAPDRLVRRLLALRGMRPDGSIRQFMETNGFTVLEHTATTFVVGLIARRGRVLAADAAAWRAAGVPHSVRIAADFRTEPHPRGARLITETRVAAADARALLAFRVYWLIVGPFSRLIRRRWLRSVVAHTAPFRSA